MAKNGKNTRFRQNLKWMVKKNRQNESRIVFFYILQEVSKNMAANQIIFFSQERHIESG